MSNVRSESLIPIRASLLPVSKTAPTWKNASELSAHTLGVIVKLSVLIDISLAMSHLFSPPQKYPFGSVLHFDTSS